MKTKIYFADLTYNTGVIACDLMPLGCGYVAAYARGLFNFHCDIRLFRKVDEFFKVVEKNPPDIFAGSCYVWNRNLVLLASDLIKKRSPKSLVVLGGLAFPLDMKRQKEFLSKHRQVDFFIPYDGEISFANLMRAYFDAGGDKDKMTRQPIGGAIYLDSKSGELVIGAYSKRPKDLDIFPSPYLTGLFDNFFASKEFTPMIQTTRGCPYTCAYCWASNEMNRFIRSFSLGRVKAELDYISRLAVKNGIYDLVIADSNFGLYEKDLAIVDTISHLQKERDYPKIFCAPCGKETSLQDVKRFSKVKGIMYALATQSTDPTILSNIKRKGMSLPTIKRYIKMVHDIKKCIGTEIITGLPYETRQTHLQTLRDLTDAGFDYIDPFTFMLLDGIELDSEDAHKKYRYDIRYRLIPRNFGKINGHYSFEVEQVVVGTDTYNFEDYMYFRGLHGLLRFLLNNAIYSELLQYLKERGVHLMDWIIFVFDDLVENDSDAARCFKMYLDEARSELWDSPEELEQYYSKDENYEKLLTRERGDNLMQKYSILASSIQFDIYVDYFFKVAHLFLEMRYAYLAQEMAMEISDIKKFVHSKLADVIRREPVVRKSFRVSHDILAWIKDRVKRQLSSYKLAEPKTILMELAPKQVKLIKKMFERYKVDEKNPYGLYRTTVLVRIDNYFRSPKMQHKILEEPLESCR